MKRTALLLCLLAASPAGAQVFLGAEVTPDAFSKGDPARIDTSGEDAFAWALGAEFSTATLYAVFGSTTPEREMLGYLRSGIYRQELAALVLLSEKVSVPVKKLATDLPKAGLRGLAAKYGADGIALFREAGELKAAADMRAPMFLPPPRSSTSPAAGLPPVEHEEN